MPSGKGSKVTELYKKVYLWRAWKKRPKPLILLELRAFSGNGFPVFLFVEFSNRIEWELRPLKMH